MAYLRLDDGFAENEAISGLSHIAFRVWMVGLGQCARNLTDGGLSSMRVKVIFALVGTNAKKPLQELVDAGLWIPDGNGGYQVKNYLKWNPTEIEVKKARERNAERQRRHRDRDRDRQEGNGASNGTRNSVTSTVSNAAPSPPIPSFGGVTDLSAPTSFDGHEKTWKSLIVATGVRNLEDLGKLERTVAANRCTERDLICAVEAATGPNVRDPLAVALTELKKRANERRAA